MGGRKVSPGVTSPVPPPSPQLRYIVIGKPKGKHAKAGGGICNVLGGRGQLMNVFLWALDCSCLGSPEGSPRGIPRGGSPEALCRFWVDFEMMLVRSRIESGTILCRI